MWRAECRSEGWYSLGSGWQLKRQWGGEERERERARKRERESDTSGTSDHFSSHARTSFQRCFAFAAYRGHLIKRRPRMGRHGPAECAVHVRVHSTHTRTHYNGTEDGVIGLCRFFLQSDRLWVCGWNRLGKKTPHIHRSGISSLQESFPLCLLHAST